MPGFVVAKLERFTLLDAADRELLIRLANERKVKFRAHNDIIREGEKPRGVNLFLRGWAARYKTLQDGRRQILAFLVPGDICDLNIYLLRGMDHSIRAISPVTLAELGAGAFETMSREHPRLLQALAWDSLVGAAIQREWTFNLGQRSAYERIAHLFCELYVRLHAVGLVQGSRIGLPLTQADLAEATGLSVVHVNRTIQEMRANNLIRWQRGELEVPDLRELIAIASFDPNYLHLDCDGAMEDMLA
jgi:CRP-like cAMP-binding protein